MEELKQINKGCHSSEDIYDKFPRGARGGSGPINGPEVKMNATGAAGSERVLDPPGMVGTNIHASNSAKTHN